MNVSLRRMSANLIGYPGPSQPMFNSVHDVVVFPVVVRRVPAGRVIDVLMALSAVLHSLTGCSMGLAVVLNQGVQSR
ncbi:hypothetical protein [Streptomyces sp. x-80]|uniref:hypothetical protein n=1 Tax=Streptomyces sp. x-80 TaxID=2789282 RepID=UPI00397EE93B